MSDKYIPKYVTDPRGVRNKQYSIPTYIPEEYLAQVLSITFRSTCLSDTVSEGSDRVPLILECSSVIDFCMVSQADLLLGYPVPNAVTCWK